MSYVILPRVSNIVFEPRIIDITQPELKSEKHNELNTNAYVKIYSQYLYLKTLESLCNADQNNQVLKSCKNNSNNSNNNFDIFNEIIHHTDMVMNKNYNKGNKLFISQMKNYTIDRDTSYYCDYYDFNNNFKKILCNKMFSFMYFEFNNMISNDNEIIKTIMIIINSLSHNGSCIIKLNNISSLPIDNMLYILSYLFNKVYLCNITNNLDNITYVRCNIFIKTINRTNMYKHMYNILFFASNILNSSNKKIHSFINYKIPYIYNNKLSLFYTKQYQLNKMFLNNYIENLNDKYY